MSKIDTHIKINGLKLEKAFEIRNGLVKIINPDLVKEIAGVYAVVLNKETIYIGSYSNTLQNRWFNVNSHRDCKKVFRHFKGEMISEMAYDLDKSAKVYAITLNQIKKKFNNHEYINHQSVELILIEKTKPILNKAHNKG